MDCGPMLPISMVCPSGRARTTSMVPMVPPPPDLFSTTAFWPPRGCRCAGTGPPRRPGVRPGAGHPLGAVGPAAARLVLPHRVLAPARLQVRGEQPRHDVGGSAGRSGNDDAGGLGGAPGTL